MIIDKIFITVQAGSGGSGCDSYFRRTDKKIIPHGGDGGHGGRVVFRASANTSSVSELKFKQKLSAEPGGNGGSTRKRGRNGKDLVVLVPPGTKIIDRARNFMIRDIEKDGEEVIVLEGGRGGLGNQGGRKPTAGEPGQVIELELDFSLRIHYFLIGLPNSGKSALLTRLTGSRAREESYPFTTQAPEIGVYTSPEGDQITLCELPSIYSHSHEGRGVGTAFLKYLEQAKALMLVVDPISKFAGSLNEGLQILRGQLEKFDKKFLEIPYLVIVNKIDSEDAKPRIASEQIEPHVPVFFVSAVTGEGMDKFKKFLDEEAVKAQNA